MVNPKTHSPLNEGKVETFLRFLSRLCERNSFKRRIYAIAKRKSIGFVCLLLGNRMWIMQSGLVFGVRVPREREDIALCITQEKINEIISRKKREKRNGFWYRIVSNLLHEPTAIKKIKPEHRADWKTGAENGMEKKPLIRKYKQYPKWRYIGNAYFFFHRLLFPSLASVCLLPYTFNANYRL